MLFGAEKLEWLSYPRWKHFEDMFIRFDTIDEHDGRMDRQTDRHTHTPHDCICRASSGNKKYRVYVCVRYLWAEQTNAFGCVCHARLDWRYLTCYNSTAESSVGLAHTLTDSTHLQRQHHQLLTSAPYRFDHILKHKKLSCHCILSSHCIFR